MSKYLNIGKYRDIRNTRILVNIGKYRDIGKYLQIQIGKQVKI